MPNAIWKYPIPPYGLGMDYTTVKMPQGAEILTAHEQRDEIYLWAKVDPSKPTVTRRIACYGEQENVNQVPDGADYIGTVFVGQHLVFHVFDLGEE